MDTAYIELPLLLLYNVITYIRFFDELSPWKAALKSVIIITIVFFLIQYAEDLLVQMIS